MKKIVIAAALFAAFYAHARTSFSESKVTKFIAGHAARAMSGDTAACDDLTGDVEVVLNADGARGRWEVEGGKNELCGYMKQTAAAFTVMQARTSTQFEDFKVKRSAFPWMSAEVSYVQRTSVSGANLPPMTIESQESVVLVRTLSGVKIQKLESTSSGGL